MFQPEHFKNGKILRRKLLIPRAAFWAVQRIQGVRLWKKCLLSRARIAYESRLDTRSMYFLRYGAEGAGKVRGPEQT